MKENNKNKKQEKEQVHIIRRQVKVIKTEENEQNKKVQNTEKSINNKPRRDNRDNVVRKNNNNKKFLNNRNSNVVIMKNGKVVEDVKKEKVNKVAETETKNKTKNNNYNKDTRENKNNKDFKNNKNQNREFKGNREGKDNKFRNNNRDNRDGNKGFSKANNTTYQVNKFIKTASAHPLEQKDTRDYQSNMLDKNKYNNYDAKQPERKEKKNKNALREQHSRVNLGNIKGLEFDSDNAMMDLYERNTDRVRKNKKTKKAKIESKNQTLIIPMTNVELPEVMTVKELAESIKKQASEVIKKLFGLGILATINQEIDFDTAYLIAEEYGITAEKKVVVTEEDILFDESEDDEKDLVQRPPVVAVMGHVDHGKTSLLDKIRSENVQGGEAGGITQHIGAYKVKLNGKEITFLDTPGHEAFTAMRARGAQVTDIAIIVVAADDGIMPQTVEAINHAKAAGVSIIVAINKMDKPTANPDRVKQELLENGLVPEEWGGDTICVPVSAMTGDGIEELLEMILLVAEVKDLKTNPKKQAKGTVIESRLDNKKGTIASLLVQRGELNVGDTIVVGNVIGKIRAMVDDKGKKVKKAGPSTPVEILGLPHVPDTGEVFYEVENEKVAKQLVEKRKAQLRRGLIKEGSKVTLDDLFSQIKQGEIKDLNIIIKADVQGSVQALRDSLLKLSNDEVRVRIIHSAAGAISESDITLASVSNAIIIGFNVRPDSRITTMAEKEKVDLRLYRVIYDAIEDVEAALKGMLTPVYREQFHGTAEIRNIFKITGVGTVAGCYVKQGKVVRNGLIRVVRDGVVIAEDKIDSLKRMKDDAREVAEGYECGIKLEKFNDIKNTDILECFEMIEEERK